MPRQDDDYVQQLQKRIAIWDRWRLAIACCSATCLMAQLAFAGWCMSSLNNLAPGNLPVQLNLCYLFLAMMLGAMVGFHLHKLLHYTIEGFVGGFRAERLLVRHYTPATNGRDHERIR